MDFPAPGGVLAQTLRTSCLSGGLAALALALVAPVHADVKAPSGLRSLGTLVNGERGGRCAAGLCVVSGGTAAGSNLFHRLSELDTRGAVRGIQFQNKRHQTVVVGVTNPLGSWIDKTIQFSKPGDLLLLSPGGIHMSAGAGFHQINQLGLSTASRLALQGSPGFDVFSTTAFDAARLAGAPLLNAQGLQVDATARKAAGITGIPGITAEGIQISVDRALLLDAVDGSVQLRDAQLSVQPEQGLGGSIAVLGQSVALTGRTVLNVQGPAGGGQVLLGGDQRGINPAVRNAQHVLLEEGSQLLADATVSGQGGRVVVWSDQHTQVYGTISAQGGPDGGDGGFVETSSAKLLNVSGRVSTAAPKGRPGQWLLDPEEVVIAPDSEVAQESASEADAQASTISAESLQQAVDEGTVVTVEAQGEISGADQVSANPQSGGSLTTLANQDTSTSEAGLTPGVEQTTPAASSTNASEDPAGTQATPTISAESDEDDEEVEQLALEATAADIPATSIPEPSTASTGSSTQPLTTRLFLDGVDLRIDQPSIAAYVGQNLQIDVCSSSCDPSITGSIYLDSLTGLSSLEILAPTRIELRGDVSVAKSLTFHGDVFLAGPSITLAASSLEIVNPIRILNSLATAPSLQITTSEASQAIQIGSSAQGSPMALQIQGDTLTHLNQAPVSQLTIGDLSNIGGISVSETLSSPKQLQMTTSGSVQVEASGALHASQRVGIEGSAVMVAGAVSASDGLRGGEITILGDSILLTDTAQISARGDQQGGLIQLGGSWQNSNPAVRQALQTEISRGARIDASATRLGDGGTIVAWSDVANASSYTRAYGSFLAEGGMLGGAGGRIETSGYGLDVSGIEVSTRSVDGTTGLWLLDPSDITIYAGTGSICSPTACTGDPTVFQTLASTGLINIADLQTALNSSNVEVTTAIGSGGSGNITWQANANLSVSTSRNLTLKADGNIQINSNYTQGGSGSLSLLAGQGSGTGGVSGSGVISLNGGTLTVEVDTTSPSDFTGRLEGNASLLKQGSGVFAMAGANTYTGLTSVSQGTLRLATGGSLSDQSALNVESGAVFQLAKSGSETIGSLSGSGSVVLATTPDTLVVGASTQSPSSTFSGVISGSGSLEKVGLGTLALTGANTYTGTTTVSSGALSISNSSALGSSAGGTTIASDASLELSGNITISDAITISGTGISGNGAIRNLSGNNQISGLLTLAANSEIQSDDGALKFDVASGNGIQGAFNLTFDGAGTSLVLDTISTGAHTLTKSGAGVLVLTGANTFTGGTFITGGSLALDDDAASGRFGATSTSLGTGAVSVSPGAGLNLAGRTLGNSVTLAGGLSQGQPGGSILNGRYFNTADYDGSYLGKLTGSLTLGAPGTLALQPQINSGYTVELAGQISGAGGLNKLGDGQLVLSNASPTNANSFAGGITVSEGSIRLLSPSALSTGPVTVESGAFLDLYGAIVSTNNTLTLNGFGNGVGALVNSSVSPAEYLGPIVLASDASIVAESGPIDLISSSPITGVGFDLYLGGAIGGSISSSIDSGIASLNKLGTGLWDLTSETVYPGPILVANGTLIVNDNVLTVPGPSAGSSGPGNDSGSVVFSGPDVDLGFGDFVDGDFSDSPDPVPFPVDGADGLDPRSDDPAELDEFGDLFGDPDEFYSFFGDEKEAVRLEDFVRELGGFEDLQDAFAFFGDPAQFGDADDFRAVVDQYSAYLALGDVFADFDELVAFRGELEAILDINSVELSGLSPESDFATSGLGASFPGDSLGAVSSGFSEQGPVPQADGVSTSQDAEAFASFFGERSIQQDGLSVDISVGSSFFAESSEQGVPAVPSPASSDAPSAPVEPTAAAESSAVSASGSTPPSSSAASPAVSIIPPQQAAQEFSQADVNQAQKALQSLTPESSSSAISTPSPQQIQQGLRNAVDQIRRGSLRDLNSQDPSSRFSESIGLFLEHPRWDHEGMALLASAASDGLRSDLASTPALPPAFNRALYNPAVLHIRFTENKQTNQESSSRQGNADAFLDITLMPSEGDPEGRRVEVSRSAFANDLKQLYRQLSRQESLDVQNPVSPSRRLYDVVFAPVASLLKQRGITTLLISADRGLQAVPFAALHDGTRFFGDAFAFSLTPSLALTSLAPPMPVNGKLLAAGSAVFDGLAPLPLVPTELNQVGQDSRKDKSLNQSFTPQTLLVQAADPQYSRVHVATHAEFLPGGPASSRLYSGTLPIPLSDFVKLRRERQDSPLDLISFSACRTALGDADSELGFAGLALQAGARSAVGTLWYVDDVATSAYFVQMYRYLDSGVPKAEALQLTRQAFSRGLVRLQGDTVVGPDGQVLISGLTATQQRRVEGGFANPYFWAGIELLGSAW